MAHGDGDAVLPTSRRRTGGEAPSGRAQEIRCCAQVQDGDTVTRYRPDAPVNAFHLFPLLAHSMLRSILAAAQFLANALIAAPSFVIRPPRRRIEGAFDEADFDAGADHAGASSVSRDAPGAMPSCYHGMIVICSRQAGRGDRRMPPTRTSPDSRHLAITCRAGHAADLRLHWRWRQMPPRGVGSASAICLSGVPPVPVRISSSGRAMISLDAADYGAGIIFSFRRRR